RKYRPPSESVNNLIDTIHVYVIHGHSRRSNSIRFIATLWVNNAMGSGTENDWNPSRKFLLSHGDMRSAPQRWITLGGLVGDEEDMDGRVGAFVILPREKPRTAGRRSNLHNHSASLSVVAENHNLREDFGILWDALILALPPEFDLFLVRQCPFKLTNSPLSQ